MLLYIYCTLYFNVNTVSSNAFILLFWFNAGSVPFAGVHHTTSNDYTTMVAGCRGAVHERSHSDTRAPLPSVDLAADLPLRKNIVSGT